MESTWAVPLLIFILLKQVVIPLETACRLGLPVVDVDGMGRAFLEFQMTSFYLDGINALTFIIADEKLNTVLVDAIDSHQAEEFARVVTLKKGGAADFCRFTYCIYTGKKLRYKRHNEFYAAYR
ncbi:DUF917 family protein [Candidatus Williamhamiltonella defendens]|uniref:S-methyl thiohydantoin desulfurase domain-containing protein n=1 Tax=Candidatus Williamhamiltonella defendens TaxID=138072 RepID=UPI001F453E1B|nr:DUF917 family protein [Candidatus Hamiltonella defensa]